MPAIPTHNTAVVDEPWDGPGQETKIKTPVTKAIAQGEWAWYDPNSPDNDGDDGWPDAKSGYKFPHHEVSDAGTPGAANKNGCQATLDRLDSADIPDADKAGVRQHVQHHLDAFDKSQAAARAEAFAASVENEPAPEASSGVTDPAAAPIVSAGYSDVDYLRGEHAGFELILGKPWAITREAAVEVASRVAMHTRAGHLHADEQLAKLEAASRPSATRQGADGSEIAVIPLRGTITPRGSLFSLIFGGGGGLQGFREQFRQAVADGNVSAIVLDIDSPGGLVDLVPEAASEILSARGSKPIVAVANTTTASAAYWIASQADQVVATPSAQVGSIGVFTIHDDFSKMDEMMGIKTTLISAGQFKTDGNPYEPLSKTAAQALQQEVDALYAMFTGQVAEGRGVSVKAVQAGYGRGRCVLADQALQLGMVDRVATLEQTVSRLGGSAPDPAPAPADLEDLDDEDGDLGIAADKTSPDSGETPAADADGSQDVSTPSDYLSERSGVPEWAL